MPTTAPAVPSLPSPSVHVLQREGFYERSYYGTTFLHPLAGTVLVLLGILTILLPRRYAILPLIVLTNFIPCSQRIALAGLDFNLLRIMILFGWTRMLMKGELKALTLNKLDKLVIAWAISETFFYFLQQRTGSAIITMCGRMMEGVGGYFMVRCFVRDWGDVKVLAKFVAFLAIPVSIFFVYEKMTGRNYFSVFGGVPEYTMVREGKIRAMGAISNPILAGCYWAALLPMMGALWWGKSRFLAPLGVMAGFFIVIACASSTPLAAFLAACLGAFLFRFRYKMAEIRKGVFWTAGVLHVVMWLNNRTGVHHLLARIDLVGGSTGWHRYHLIDQWMQRWAEWVMWGVPSTGHWGWGLWDITNQYVLESVRGGVVTLVIFIWMIVVAYKYLGAMWRSVEHDVEMRAMAWGIGACLFTHNASFIAVSYFGQMVIGWYMHLAIVGSMYAYILAQGKSEGEETQAVVDGPPEPLIRRERRKLLGAV